MEVEMVEDLAKGGKPAARMPLARPIDYMIIVVGLLLCLAIYLVLGVVKHLDQVQQDGIIRGYINRAVSCDLQKGLGLNESKACSDPAIAPYRDPAVGASSSTGARTSRETYQLLCFALRQASKNPNSTLVLPPGQCGT